MKKKRFSVEQIVGLLKQAGESGESRESGESGGIGGHDTYSPVQCYRLCMARLARIVIPGLPHHVTQRGNRREAIFFENGDHEIYLDLLAEAGGPGLK
jgi:hypothetical protein